VEVSFSVLKDLFLLSGWEVTTEKNVNRLIQKHWNENKMHKEIYGNKQREKALKKLRKK